MYPHLFRAPEKLLGPRGLAGCDLAGRQELATGLGHPLVETGAPKLGDPRLAGLRFHEDAFHRHRSGVHGDLDDADLIGTHPQRLGSQGLVSQSRGDDVVLSGRGELEAEEAPLVCEGDSEGIQRIVDQDHLRHVDGRVGAALRQDATDLLSVGGDRSAEPHDRR